MIEDTFKYYKSILNFHLKESKELKSMNFLKRPSNKSDFSSGYMATSNLPTIYDKQINTKPQRLRKMGKLGGGTYGRVYQATTDTNLFAPARSTLDTFGSFVFDPVTGQVVHMPKPGQLAAIGTNCGEMVAVKENFVSPSLYQTIGSLRELDMLNIVRDHPYCIQLKNVTYEIPFTDGSLSPHGQGNWISDKVFFVLEKGDMDGDKYIRPSTLSNGMPVVRLVNERKLFAVQVLLGLEFMHSRGIYHRDLKPHNIICFMNNHGDLTHAKVCDFGLTQYYCKQTMSLANVVTLWYRAPEISLSREYNYKVDVWSMGCILFELFSSDNKRFMQPSSDKLLLNSVIEKLPFPSEYYEAAQQLFNGELIKPYDRYQQSLRSIDQQLNYTQSQIAQFNSCQLGGKPNSGSFSQLVDLIEHCLVVNPEKRYSVSECLNHSFFDGYKELIDQTRTLYGINSDGEWITKPQAVLTFNNNSVRERGMEWFGIIYSNRINQPTCNWYSHRIFLHSIEMFDRYVCLVNPPNTTSQSDIVVYVNTFMFMNAKYFRMMVDEYGLNYFATGIYPQELPLFQHRAQQFEEHVVRDVFKCVIYQPTIFEAACEFLTENAITYIIKLLLKGKIPSGTPLNNIYSMYIGNIDQANKTSSPMPSPQAPTVTIVKK